MAPNAKPKAVKPMPKETVAASAFDVSSSSITTADSWQGFTDTTRTAAKTQWHNATQLLTDQTEKASTHMMNNMNDYSSLYRDMTSAYQQYCQTWSKGCEDLSRSYMSFCQSLTQDCMSAFKSTLSARSVQDAVSTQTEFMRSQCEKIVSETTKMGEQLSRTASEAAEPVQSQWSNVASKMTPSSTTTGSRAA